ncbi:MAG: DMT family transporter [Synergistaceae bacterium]|jgi:drug/metabolite transporter (DMT)-like permease|nr:DMT family transporter [Synergistaceae bacterium]
MLYCSGHHKIGEIVLDPSSSRQTIIADFSLMLIALFWGLGFVAMKDALESFSPFWLLTLRFFSGTALMALIFIKRLRSLSRDDLKAGSIIGLFLFLGFATQTVGLKYTTPGKQAFLTATYVVIVPFLSWMFRRKSPGLLSFLSSAICLAGMAMLTLQGGQTANLGDLLTLVCALFFACHILAIEHFARDRDPIILAVIQIGIVGLLSFPMALSFETWTGFGGGDGLGSIAFTVIFCTVLAFIVQNTAQKFTPSTHTAIIMSMESVFGALAGIYFLGEIFTARMAAGCGLIFFAVLLTEAGPSLLKAFSGLFPAEEKI